MRVGYSILKPVVTEKSLALNLVGKYVFGTNLEANKTSIEKDIKKIYGVDVIDARSLILPGKKRRQGKTARFKKTPKRKRIIVTLKEGQKIEVTPKEK